MDGTIRCIDGVNDGSSGSKPARGSIPHPGNCECTRHFSGIVTAHSIGNDEDVFFRGVRILILLAKHANVRCRTPHQFHEHFSDCW
jgi:hypothetical protein